MIEIELESGDRVRVVHSGETVVFATGSYRDVIVTDVALPL